MILKLPARYNKFEYTTLFFNKKNKYESLLKIKIRNAAKKLKKYYMQIELQPHVCGNDSGTEIPINNLGRWVFGVPGYAGHIIVRSDSENIIVQIPPIKEAIELVSEAINTLE